MRRFLCTSSNGLAGVLRKLVSSFFPSMLHPYSVYTLVILRTSMGVNGLPLQAFLAACQLSWVCH